MAYESLKSEIRQYIKTNGQNEITGQILQNILIDMVNQYPSLDGYATQQWVLNQNYVTSAILGNYLPLSAGQNNALTGDLYVGANSIHLDYNTTAGSAYSNISHEKIVVGSTLNIINGEFTATIKNDGTIQLYSYHDVLGEVVEYNTILGPHAITTGGNVTADAFVKAGGTAAQFLKADGSVDNSTYLTSLAVAGLSDVVLTNLTNGQALVYDSTTSKWINTTIQGGGGGTVTSIDTGTGLTGGPITTSGTISISSTYQTYISHGESAYNSLANYLPLNGGGTITNANDYSLNISEKGLLFYYNGSLYGSLSLTSTPDGPVFDVSSNLTIGGNTIWNAGNFPLSFSTLANGQALVYNGTNWTNASVVNSVAGYQGTVTTTELATALGLSSYVKPTIVDALADGVLIVYDSGGWITQRGSTYLSSYATQSWVGNNYLPLEGGTLSGILTIAPPISSSYQDALVLHDSGSGSSEGSRIRFTSASYTTGITLGPNSDKTALLINDTDIIATRTWVGQQGYITSLAVAGLSDVVLTNLTNGQALVYNGTNWANASVVNSVAGYQGTVTAAELASALSLSSYVKPTIVDALADGVLIVYDSGGWITQSGSTYLSSYAKTSDLANYLPLNGGGTITNANDYSLNISEKGLLFYYNGSLYGSLSLTSTPDGPVFDVSSNLTIGGNTIWNAGNFPLSFSTLANGQALVYNGTNWANASVVNSVAGYQGTVTAAELASALSLSSYVKPTIVDALADGVLIVYDSGGWITQSGSTYLSSYATQSWVQQQGYITSSGSCNYAATAGSATQLSSYAIENFMVFSNENSDYLNASFTNLDFSAKAHQKHIEFWDSGGRPDTGWYNFTIGSLECINTLSVAEAANLCTTSGSVGIGTTSPSYKLDVNGTINGTTIYQNGNAVRTSGDTYISSGTIYIGSNSITPLSSSVLSGYLPLNGGGTLTATGSDIKMLFTNEGMSWKVSGTTYGSILFSMTAQTGPQINLSSAKVGGYDVRTTNDCYISGNTIYVGSNSLTVSSGGSGTVTSVATGTGLTGGTITTSGTISISSTYRTYISNGNTAYGWGNHADAGYLQSASAMYFFSSGNYLSARFATQSFAVDAASNFIEFWQGGAGFFNFHVGSVTQVSDIRNKDVTQYGAEPPIESIAHAPSIIFTWKEGFSVDKRPHVGSIAQYWQTILPEAVTKDSQGYLSMQYDVIALLSAISVAKRVTEHERRIETLERENALLRLELNQIKMQHRMQ